MLNYIQGLDSQKLNKLCAHLVDSDSTATPPDFAGDWSLSKPLITAILNSRYCLSLFPSSDDGLTINLIAPTLYQQILFTGSFPQALVQAGAFVCILEKFGSEWNDEEVQSSVIDFLAE